MQPSRLLTAVATLAVLVWSLAAYADDRRWITSEDGRTVGYIKESPYGSGKMIVRDRAGQAVRIIEPDVLDDGHGIQDRHGDRLGRVEELRERRYERGERRDWRDGPAKRWGSHDDRWGR